MGIEVTTYDGVVGDRDYLCSKAEVFKSGGCCRGTIDVRDVYPLLS